MKKTLLYAGIGLILIVFIFVAIFSIKNKPATVAPQGNYKTVHDVQGISFDVNTSFTSKATAVSEISGEMEISRDEYYVYKNGSTKYLLFCMNDILIAVEKGTSFNFGDKLNYTSVQNSGVAGVWFESNSDELKYDKKSDRTICEVNGGFCVTSEVYEDYIGKLCVMNNGEEEWGLFVGVPGKDLKYKKLDDNVKDGIEYIINSMQYSDFVNEIPEEVYEVAIGNEDTRPKETETEDIADVITPIPTETPTPEEEESTESIEVQSESSDNTEIIIEDPAEEQSKEDNPEPDVQDEESSEELLSEEDKPEEVDVAQEPETTPTPAPEESEVENQRGEAIRLSNQKTLTKIDSKAYSSSIYSMLSLKDNGIISEYDLSTGELVTPIISIRRVYTGQKAINKIKDYCYESGELNYFEPPVGCSWHVAEYYILWKDCPTRPYIDIKLKGLDGENLKYKGIKYQKRTYDIFTYKEEKDDAEGNLFCFYAIPNGCKDYVLECGTGNIDKVNSGCSAAYFRVKY